MSMKDCMLAVAVDGELIGCDGRCRLTAECKHCGWYAPEDARRRKLPLRKGKNGLLSRQERGRAKRQKPVETVRPAPREKTPAIRRDVIHTASDGTQTVYVSIKEAAETAKVTEKTMARWLRGETQRVETAKEWRFAE